MVPAFFQVVKCRDLPGVWVFQGDPANRFFWIAALPVAEKIRKIDIGHLFSLSQRIYGFNDLSIQTYRQKNVKNVDDFL